MHNYISSVVSTVWSFLQRCTASSYKFILKKMALLSLPRRDHAFLDQLVELALRHRASFAPLETVGPRARQVEPSEGLGCVGLDVVRHAPRARCPQPVLAAICIPCPVWRQKVQCGLGRRRV